MNKLFLSIAITFSYAQAGTLVVENTKHLNNPDILAYNLGHFMPDTNVQDFWRYSGVNGARFFLSPSTIEANDDIDGHGDGVTNQSSFLTRKDNLRADPLNEEFINWPYLEDRYENTLVRGNRFFTNFMMQELNKLNIKPLVQITGSEGSLPITSDNDWAGKWEFWQHYYFQAFYLARHYDVERFQMYNEPNHSNAGGLTPENWLMRLQLASDAIQSAIADVNSRYNKSLTPLVYGPVNSGGNKYSTWGELAVENRHVNFLGETDPNYLVMHRYDYHEYNGTRDSFVSTLNSLRADITETMAPETRFRMSISEFNVHTNSTFDNLSTTLDTPEKFTRLGSISSGLARNFMKEFYCFKFGQTDNISTDVDDANFPVKKNGMHYVQNSSDDDYMYGGATRAAEVWRLFNKALKPGGDQLRFVRDSDDSIDDIDLQVTFDPGTNNYYIFLSNESNTTSLSVDVSAWDLEAGTPFLLEEVSENYYGTVRRKGTIGSNNLLEFDPNDTDLNIQQDTVWLITIPAGDIQAEEVINASFDATVTDGSSATDDFSNNNSLLVRNDPNTRDNRSAGLIQFDLPVIYPPDIQMAVLSVDARIASGTTNTQSHLYGLDHDTWADDNSLTWNTTPNLLQDVPAGNLIKNRYIAEQGTSAHLQGQLVFNRDSYKTRITNVTEFIKAQSDHKASFMISQDPRWDVAIPSLEEGDTQISGLEIASSETNNGPQLRILRLKDSDNDGISDHAETTIFSTDPNEADADGDGLNDGEELLLYLTNPTKADSDDDGIEDSDEVIAQTDPNDNTSLFKIDEIKISPTGQVSVRWNSILGVQYMLYRSQNLAPDSWGSPITTEVGTGDPMEYEDTPPSSFNKAFYRLGVSE